MPENSSTRSLLSVKVPPGLDFSAVTAANARNAEVVRQLRVMARPESPTMKAIREVQASARLVSASVALSTAGSLVQGVANGLDISGATTVLDMVARASRLAGANAAPLQALTAHAEAISRSTLLPALRSSSMAYASMMEAALPSILDLRLSALQLAYRQQLGGPADAFGRLDDAVGSIPSLAAAVDDMVEAARTPGPLGFDQRRVEAAALRVDAVLADPDVERAVVEPIEEVRALIDTGETVFYLPDVLGTVRSFRPSTGGVIFGFTVALTHFVLNVANGTPWSVEAVNAVVDGAGIYGLVASRRPREDRPQSSRNT